MEKLMKGSLFNKVVNDQIRFHKLQNLIQWFHDDNYSQNLLHNKIRTSDFKTNESLKSIGKDTSVDSTLSLNVDFRIILKSKSFQN